MVQRIVAFSCQYSTAGSIVMCTYTSIYMLCKYILFLLSSLESQREMLGPLY